MKALSNSQRKQRRNANRSYLLSAAVIVALLALLLTAGCAQSPPEQQPMEDQQQQNEELQKQIDQLKKEQEDQAKKQEEQNQEPQIVIENNENMATAPAQAGEGVVAVSPDVSTSTDLESGALNATVNYYAAVEAGDYTYTYDALSAADQRYYTYDEWQYANTALDSAASKFEVFRALVDSPNTAIVDGYPHVADVGVTINYSDGSTGTRYTFFVYEGGMWKHWLTSEETELFDSVLSASATATATPTATAKQSSTAASETCEPSALATRLWEGWVAPSDPFGHPPCQNAEGTYRSYIPLGYGITPMEKYLDAAESGDYDTMYNLLAPADQQYYTLDEWRQANEAVGTDQSTYEMAGTLVGSDEQGATVGGQAIVKITVPTGETVTKYWWFGPAHEGGPEDGPWVHWLNTEEIDLLDDALASR
jgi:type II secretory pathway component PulJ